MARRPTPATPSYELSGEVAATAPDVDSVATGELVYSLTDFDRDGAAADYVTVPAELLAPKPRSLDHVSSAAIPLAALSAWQGLFDHGHLEAGQRVLILGAAGGVGHLATQLARWRGAHVIGTASPANAEFANGLGAHELLDGTDADLTGLLDPLDLVFDCVGGEVLQRSAAIVREGGRLVSVTEEPPVVPEDRKIETTYFVVEPNREPLVELTRIAESGDLRPAIDSVFPLMDARTAFQRSMERGKRGKVVRRSRRSEHRVISQREKAEAFRALHDGEPFVIPNPWDAGSARVLAALGFEALATTSSGLAFTLGRLDGSVTLDEVVDHAVSVDRATDLPVSVDLENGYGPDPQSAASAITRVAEAGAVGGSIEDFDREGYLYEKGLAVDRIVAAVEAAQAAEVPFTLTARAENHIRDNPDLNDTISRLQAFEEAGADVLYAPGLTTLDEIRAACGAVTRPVNVLAVPELPLDQIFEAGAQRVSVGGGLTWIAVGAMATAAQSIRDTGDLSSLTARVPLDRWFA